MNHSSQKCTAPSGEVQNNLVNVKWLPSICGCTIQFNNVNGAADKMREVSDGSEATLGAEFHKYVSKTAGTFNWRKIAGTNRISTHAFGTAIDINTKYSNYWQWDGNMVWKNQIPSRLRYSRNTASFGAASGITTIPCILNTDLNCLWSSINQ